MIVYLGLGKNPDVTTAGLFYGHPNQRPIQAGVALTVIVWDALVTFLILGAALGLFMKLRLPDEVLQAWTWRSTTRRYPSEALTRVGSGAVAPTPAAPAEATRRRSRATAPDPPPVRPAVFPRQWGMPPGGPSRPPRVLSPAGERPFPAG